MTLKESVQKRYEKEIESLSSQARIAISRNFSDFSRLMAFHDHGPYAFKSFSSSDHVREELFAFSNRIFAIYVKEQIEEWKSVAKHDSSSPSLIAEMVFDNYLQKSYRLILQTEERFVQKLIKNNCPHYTQALCFIKREKSINDFLRCSESERKKLILFFDKFGEIYNEIISFYNHNKKETSNGSESSMLTKVTDKTTAKSDGLKTQKAKTKTTKVSKPQQKKKSSNSITKSTKNKSKRLPDDIEEDLEEIDSKSPKYIEVSIQNRPFIESDGPSVYDTPHFYFDDLTMMARVNYGCNGSISFGLSSNYITPSFSFLYNFERDIIKQDPDANYHKPIVSDRISRSAHGYKWFGVNGMDYMISLKKYGIVAKCVNLYFGDYIFY